MLARLAGFALQVMEDDSTVAVGCADLCRWAGHEGGCEVLGPNPTLNSMNADLISYSFFPGNDGLFVATRVLTLDATYASP